MGLGDQFNTIIYFQDTGDIYAILPSRYIKSRKDLNRLLGMKETVGMKFFYVYGYFPLNKKDWTVRLASGSSAPRLVSLNGTDSALLLSQEEARFIISSYKKILFEFEGGMGDYLDQVDVVLQVLRSSPLLKITCLLDASRIAALQLIQGFNTVRCVGRRDEVIGKLPSIKFNRINELAGNYMPSGKIGAYSMISGLDAPAPRSPVILDRRELSATRKKLRTLIGRDHTSFFILHTMSGNTNAKSIRPADVVDLLTPLINKKGVYFLHVGGSGEEVIKHSRIISLQGKLSWVEVFYLTSISDGCVCIDSAVMHIAQHFNIPVLSLWGPTNPANILGPDSGVNSIITSEACAGCNRYECTPSLCMRNFNKAALKRALKKFSGG